MGNDKTRPDKTDPNTNTSPISRVESRVIPTARVKPSTVDPRVEQARRTFAALVVAATNPPIHLKIDFKLTGVGVLHTSSVTNLLLVDQNTAAGPGFILSFEYRGREVLKHVDESEKVHDAVRKMLYDYGLVFKSAASAMVNRITIDPVVPAAVTVAGDRAHDRVTITLRNVALLGAATYTLPAERFDRKLVDALVELISAHDRTFYTLVAGAR